MTSIAKGPLKMVEIKARDEGTPRRTETCVAGGHEERNAEIGHLQRSVP
jgi:hypothetical protein